MKLKKTLMSLLALVSAGIVIIPAATSCSGVSQSIIDNLVNKGDSTQFANGYDNLKMFQLGMKSSSSYKAFKAKLVDDLLYDWYKRKCDSESSFKDNWSDWEKNAKKSYDDKVSSYKDSHKNDWQYYFQNEVLDPVGGTKDAYIRNEMCNSIRSEFTKLVFASKDLAIGADSTAATTYDERANIIKDGSKVTINNSANWPKMHFYSECDPMVKTNPLLANEYAVIQENVFNMWMKDIKPISTAACLWKYSTPSSGMESIYNKDKIPADAQKSGGSNDDEKGWEASYEFPAFQAPAGPSSSSPTASDKYFDFANQWASNNFIEGTEGKINIPMKYTDDPTATLMIAESKNVYDKWDSFFAGTVADLWDAYAMNSDSHIKNDLKNAPLITPKFIQDTDILNNFFFKADDTLTVESLGKYLIDLNDLYETNDKLGNKFSSMLFNQTTSPYAGSTTASGVRYAINSVRLTKDAAATDKLPYIMIRDTFGVHVIGLDCAEYIKKSTDVWKAEGEVLKFRSLMEASGASDEGTGMELSSTLSSYFSDNLDDIVLKMLADGTTAHKDKTSADTVKIFDEKDEVWDGKSKELILEIIKNGADFYRYYDIISTIDAANKKLFDINSKYVKNRMIKKSGNIIPDIYGNGLVVALPFVLASGNPADAKILSETAFYNVTKLTYGFDVSEINPVELTEQNLINVEKDFTSAIAKWWSNDKVKPTPLTSTSSYLKYSEHIIFDRNDSSSGDKYAVDAVNALFNSFGSSSNDISNIIKYDAYSKYAAKLQNPVAFADPLTSIYETGKVLTDNTPITYYKNDATLSTVEEFKSLVYSSFKSNFARSITTHSDLYSDDSVNYQLTLASLQYLVSNNYENLFTYLKNAVPQNTQAYIVWNEKDLISPYTSTFQDKCTDVAGLNSVFGYVSNYQGLYDKLYQSTNMDSDPAVDRGFIANANYYHFSDMPFLGADSTVTSTQAMGFVGIQTATSNSDVDPEVSNILFNKSNCHFYNQIGTSSSENPAANGEGCLYQYGSRERIKNYINSSYDINQIKLIATNIQNCIPDNNDYNQIVSLINRGKKVDGTDMKTAQDYKDVLLPAFDDTNNIITDNMFKGFNFKVDNSKPQQPTLIGLGGVQLKSNNATTGYANQLASGGYARTYAIQINNDDLNFDLTKSDEFDAFLKTIGGSVETGEEILNTIAVQYAMKSEVQVKAIKSAIDDFGGKIVVYDRRLNDQLGSSWVKNYKDKN